VEATADALTSELPGLLRYARMLTRNDDAAAELVQLTAVRALEKQDQFRGEAKLGTWLHRIMYRQYLDQLRRHEPIPVDEAELVAANDQDWSTDGYTVSSEAVVERAQDRQALLDALIRLPITYRVAVLLHDLEGLTAAQIAEVEQVSLPAAKQRIRRGRQLLVSALAGADQRRAELIGVPLNCWTARSRISDFLDEELTPGERAGLERHLAACPTCPALYASIVGVSGVLNSMRDPDSVIPAELAQRIRKAQKSPRR
jgi:RNA polymerase sigma-70 factor, ECF subfamily